MSNRTYANYNLRQQKTKKWLKDICSVKTLKKRLPIIEWLPKYKKEYIFQDIIAGITVGLTAIPQGMAYAVIAGLPPEYGLYASLTSGIIYVIFGSCYNITVGPTAVVSTLTTRYVVSYSPDFAILVAFLSGVLILLLGILNLGSLVEFISVPVINGFINAATLQIAASQLKSFFGLQGSSGSYFGESIYHFFMNIKTAQLWEPILGSTTIILLILLKKMGEGCKRTDGIIKQLRWFISLSRNAVVVIVGMIIAYTIKLSYDSEPFILIGYIGHGLPQFSWPPFSTIVGNDTYTFTQMIQTIGVQFVVIPFVSIIETVAIAKAFAEDGRIDATQEMIAVGLCNIVGSFGKSMPITGSFARTALNHISGVKTPAGGVTKVLLLVVALTYFTSTFYYIPKATLAGLIITAMFSMMDYTIVSSLWKNSVKEFLLWQVTVFVSLFCGLEYGIIIGILAEALLLLYNVSKPSLKVEFMQHSKGNLMVVHLCENISYCAAEYVRENVIKATSDTQTNVPIIFNGIKLRTLDFTSASNFMSIIKDLDKTHDVILLNFSSDLKKLCSNVDSLFESNFMYASSPLELTSIFTKDV